MRYLVFPSACGGELCLSRRGWVMIRNIAPRIASQEWPKTLRKTCSLPNRQGRFASGVRSRWPLGWSPNRGLNHVGIDPKCGNELN